MVHLSLGPAVFGSGSRRASGLRSGFVLGSLACVVCLTALALAGWLTGDAGMATLMPGLPTMKANTALCFVLLVLGVAGQASGLRAAARHLLALGPVVAALLAGATLIQYLTGADFGIDQALVEDRTTAPGDFPGRMAPATAVAILLLSAAVSLASGVPSRWRPLPALLAFAIGYVTSIGLLFDADWGRGIGDQLATVPLPSATCIVLLGSAVLMVTPWKGTMLDEASADNAGGRFLRGALPVLMVLPAAIFWAQHLAEVRGWWSGAGGLVLGVSVLIVALIYFAVRSARWISALERDLKASRDLFEQRVIERTAELSSAVERLGASRQQLANMIETAATAIITLDARRRIVLCNAEAERVFGYAAVELLGQPIELLLPERLRGTHARHVARFAETGDTLRPMGGDAKLLGRRRSGEEFPLAASISKVGSGDELLLTVVLRDLSPAQELEQERAARSAAELSSRMKSEFLSRVSHELRTPLNAITGFAQLLEMDGEHPLQPRQRDFVGHIGHAGRQLQMLVGDLLDLGRAESGHVHLDNDHVDVVALAREAVAMVSAQAADAGIAVALQPDASAAPGRVWADPGRVLQILTNLLSNAVKYNRPHGSVRVSVADDGDEVVVAVQDTGDGLGPAQLRHLFEPFNRLGRERGRLEGSGIGLALSQRLAGLMGGRIDVSSEPGVGSVFRLRLPHSPGPAPQG